MTGLPTATDAAPMPDDTTVQAAVRAMAQARGTVSSLCPSEVARALDADQWRRLMPVVRQAAAALACAGEVEVLQRGQVQSPRGPWRGPIRIRLAGSQ
jgi:Protein of unknown function (DUF3253)